MNSWQQPVSGEPSAGTLHFIPEASRAQSEYDLADTSVSDTWEECDLSAKVPVGTTAVYGLMNIYGSDATDVPVLCVRDGAGSETDTTKTFTMRIAAEQGAAALRMGTPVTIKATNGVFDYRRFSSSYPVNTLAFILWGYYL